MSIALTTAITLATQKYDLKEIQFSTMDFYGKHTRIVKLGKTSTGTELYGAVTATPLEDGIEYVQVAVWDKRQEVYAHTEFAGPSLIMGMRASQQLAMWRKVRDFQPLDRGF